MVIFNKHMSDNRHTTTDFTVENEKKIESLWHLKTLYEIQMHTYMYMCVLIALIH